MLLSRYEITRNYPDDGDPGDSETNLKVACSTTRIVEDLLSQDLIKYAQLHVYVYEIVNT